MGKTNIAVGAAELVLDSSRIPMSSDGLIPNQSGYYFAGGLGTDETYATCKVVRWRVKDDLSLEGDTIPLDGWLNDLVKFGEEGHWSAGDIRQLGEMICMLAADSLEGAHLEEMIESLQGGGADG